MESHKIVKIEPFLLYDKLEEPFYFSQFEYRERRICIVKITLENGIVGWGEGYGPGILVKAGIEYFKPFVLGKNALHHENIWQDMYRMSYDYARKGILLSALSAIDVALWDIKGKILNQPVSTLLGGRKRERVKLYATGLYFTKGGNLKQKLAKEALGYKDMNFLALKMKVGLGLSKDIEMVSAVRSAVGDDMEIMVDANHAYCLTDARKFISKVEHLNLSWFEEPLLNEDYKGYAELRKYSPIPIAAGECEYLKFGALEMLKRRCVDIFQPDTCACGGITEVKKIQALTDAHLIKLTPHNWGTGIAIAANLHIMSNMNDIPQKLFQNELILELDCSPNRLRQELLTSYFQIHDGYATVPNKPGLGIEVNEEKIKEFSPLQSIAV